jgi:hypothetical protein
MSRAALRPAGSGGAGPSAASPLLDDVPASPASRLLAVGPAALGTRPTAFFSNLLQGGTVTCHHRLRTRLVLMLALCLAVPAAALRAEDLSNFVVAALGGIGGSPDAKPGRDYGNPTFQLDLARIVEPQALVGIHVGHLALDRKPFFGPLQNADMTYVNVGGEYRYQESYYESGIFIGIGGYRLGGKLLDGTSHNETAVGGTLGVTGEFKINRSFGVLIEISGHYVDFKDQKVFAMAHAGFSYHF